MSTRQKSRDFRLDTKDSRRRMLPIYGRTAHCYQMDTLEQSKKAKNNKKAYATTPPYFLIIVNINSRKGYAYPMTMKNAKHVLHALTQFLVAHRMTHLYTDSDPAYTDPSVATMLKNHKVIHTKTNNDNKHVLGIVNRFIKTLRDKNGSDERDITTDDMKRLIETYNNTVHKTTQCKPNDWTDAKNEAWIEQKHREMIAKQGADDIHVGSQVRIPKKHDVFDKVRVHYEPGEYTVTGIDGNRYQVLKDDEVVTFSRFQLRYVPQTQKRFLSKEEQKNRMSIKEKLAGLTASNVVSRILSYDSVSKRYMCLWEDGSNAYCTIKNLRGTDPNRLNLLEREFWKDKASFEIPEEIKQLMPRYAAVRKPKRIRLVIGPKNTQSA